MLGKLLKYDLKKTFKFLVVFYILAIFFAGLTRLFFGLEQNLLNQILGQIAMGTTISIMVSILINNIMRIFVYFKANLYGDESYLTHTLPVERKTLFLTKFLLTVITLFSSILVILLAFLIAFYSKDNFEAFKIMLSPITQILDTTIVKFVLAVIGIVFLEILSLVMSGIVGIIFGHRKLSKRVDWSVLFGFGFYIIAQILIMGALAIFGLFIPKIGTILFTQNPTMDIETIKAVVIFSVVFYSIIIAGLYLIGQKAFKKIDIE